MIIRILILCMLPFVVMAKEQVGIGHVAENLMQPVNLMSDFIHSACLLLGVAFIFTCIVKYIEHRRSPLMVPISTVIFFLIAGILLLLLPFLSLFVENSVHYSLLN